jgi:hypothetical protein
MFTANSNNGMKKCSPAKGVFICMLVFVSCLVSISKAEQRLILKTSLSEYYQGNLEFGFHRWALTAGLRITPPMRSGSPMLVPSLEIKRYRRSKSLVFGRFAGAYARYMGNTDNRSFTDLQKSDLYVGAMAGLSTSLGKWYAEIFAGAGVAVVHNIRLLPYDLRLNLSIGRILYKSKPKRLLKFT